VNAQSVDTSAKNLFQRFYGSSAFDTFFGIVLPVVTGIYSLVIDVVLIYSFVHEPNSRPLFVFILGLSVLGGLGCIALVISVLSRARLGDASKSICVVLLICGVAVGLVLMGLLALVAAGSFGNGGLWLLVPSILSMMISLAAIKQIGLLRRSKPGRLS
jgi:hypothetical protein